MQGPRAISDFQKAHERKPPTHFHTQTRTHTPCDEVLTLSAPTWYLFASLIAFWCAAHQPELWTPEDKPAQLRALATHINTGSSFSLCIMGQ